MRSIIILFFLWVATFNAFAQEFNFRVNVSAARLQTADPKIFKTLQDEINNFMNDRKWTDDTFSEEEKIEGSMNINITDELSADRYKAQVSIQVNRPTYSSDYKTALLNYNDRDLNFQYQEFQALDFNENDYLQELTSFLAYYAYVSLGLYYDSFAMEGGTPYWLKAQTVVNNAQNGSPNGSWKAFTSDNNRYWFVENVFNNRYRGMREVSYKYHRQGLDNMFDDVFTGREAIINCFETLERVHKESPSLMIMQLFFNAKSNEISKIMQKASPIEKTKVINTLTKLDPSNSSRYQKILSGR